MQKMYVNKITVGAMARKAFRAALDELELSGEAEYREVKGLLESTFVVKANANTWNNIIKAIKAWNGAS